MCISEGYTSAGFHYVIAETLWNVKPILAQAEERRREPLDLGAPSSKGKSLQTKLAVGLPAPAEERVPEERWCEVVGEEDGRRHIGIWSEEKRGGGPG